MYQIEYETKYHKSTIFELMYRLLDAYRFLWNPIDCSRALSTGVVSSELSSTVACDAADARSPQ